MSKGHVKRRLSPGSSALRSRREVALRNISIHVSRDHSKISIDSDEVKLRESQIEKHLKESTILKSRIAG